jgi:membrane protein YdbS with pleckstrin-like domain
MNESEELFKNSQLDIRLLPAVEDLEIVLLEPNYKKVRYIMSTMIAFVIIAASWTFVSIQPDFMEFVQVPASIITLLAFWFIIYNGISFHYMGYALREKDISFQSGWLWKSMTTVPFNRVQHCDIRQGLIDRQFGLSKLTIYTAGGQSADLMIPGLLPDTAEKIKSYILNSTEQSIEAE